MNSETLKEANEIQASIKSLGETKNMIDKIKGMCIKMDNVRIIFGYGEGSANEVHLTVSSKRLKMFVKELSKSNAKEMDTTITQFSNL